TTGNNQENRVCVLGFEMDWFRAACGRMRLDHVPCWTYHGRISIPHGTVYVRMGLDFGFDNFSGDQLISRQSASRTEYVIRFKVSLDRTWPASVPHRTYLRPDRRIARVILRQDGELSSFR